MTCGDRDRIEEARRCGFYPLVLLLERLAGGAPVGSALFPGEERVRFRHDPALAFSTGDVAEVRELEPHPGGPGGRAFEVTTTFLGLTGAVTPLPHYIAEEVAQEDADAPRRRAFLDLFHDRLVSLLYRGCAKYDLANCWRSDSLEGWALRLLALLGVDVSPGETRPPLPAWRLLRLAPLLVEPTITAAGLAAAVEDALQDELGGAKVEVEPFAGTWAAVASDQVTRLGLQASRLGVDCLVGQRVWDAGGRFRVLVGPLTAEGYRRFADGRLSAMVEELVSALVVEPLEHEIVLSLKEDAAPALELGVSRLGKDSWLGRQRRAARITARAAA